VCAWNHQGDDKFDEGMTHQEKMLWISKKSGKVAPDTPTDSRMVVTPHNDKLRFRKKFIATDPLVNQHNIESGFRGEYLPVRMNNCWVTKNFTKDCNVEPRNPDHLLYQKIYIRGDRTAACRNIPMKINKKDKNPPNPPLLNMHCREFNRSRWCAKLNQDLPQNGQKWHFFECGIARRDVRLGNEENPNMTKKIVGHNFGFEIDCKTKLKAGQAVAENNYRICWEDNPGPINPMEWERTVEQVSEANCLQGVFARSGKYTNAQYPPPTGRLTDKCTINNNFELKCQEEEQCLVREKQELKRPLKVNHTLGFHSYVEMQIFPNSEYNGMLKQCTSSSGLMRFSMSTRPDLGEVTTLTKDGIEERYNQSKKVMSVAFKFPRSQEQAADLMGMFDFDGHTSPNLFQTPMSTAIRNLEKPPSPTPTDETFAAKVNRL